MRLDTASVLERIFAVYGAQFRVLFLAALVVFVPVGIVVGLLAASGSVVLALVGLVLGLVASFWYQAVVVEAVRDIQDGRRDFTVGGLFASVRPVVPALIGLGLLAGIGIALGLALLIVPGLVLLTLWSVAVPALVVERVGVTTALGRSRALVRGNGFRVFGVVVVVFLLYLTANQLLAVLADALADAPLVSALVSLVASAAVAPFIALAAAVLYLDLRRLHGEAEVPAS